MAVPPCSQSCQTVPFGFLARTCILNANSTKAAPSPCWTLLTPVALAPILRITTWFTVPTGPLLIIPLGPQVWTGTAQLRQDGHPISTPWQRRSTVWHSPLGFSPRPWQNRCTGVAGHPQHSLSYVGPQVLPTQCLSCPSPNKRFSSWPEALKDQEDGCKGLEAAESLGCGGKVETSGPDRSAFKSHSVPIWGGLEQDTSLSLSFPSVNGDHSRCEEQ